MFVNISNHPSKNWERPQKEAAESFGVVIDMPFPNVRPSADENEVTDLAQKMAADVLALFKNEIDRKENHAILVIGEQSLSFTLINLLLDNGLVVVASTTERNVKTDHEGNKISTFNFVRFRKYTR